MLTGEKRWVSARRGMTVLGKVSVPKPVNLPSQRLENHGLDPNVAIVPKGTLSWGSRPSSSALNAWGSSALSPPATDVNAGLPSPLTSRPSSGGSGTRPSTAGSERSHEPVSNAWGSNSRPSSASGILASNQTSMASTRPRSAETRPGSSQLSRFSEPVPETSGAWGGPRMAEKLGTSSTKHNEFTLSRGDFPTLGSEKNSEFHARQGHSSHGRPVSSGDSASQQERPGTPTGHSSLVRPLSSGDAASQQERPGTPTGDGPEDASVDKGDVNTWRREASPQLGGGTPTSMVRSQRDPQQAQPYPNMNMPSYHFEPWHGTPIRNSPEGVWYGRGPPTGPYRPAVPPGGYPLESFVYYPSQLPSRPVSNSQAGPRPGASPNAYHPKNGNTYRTHTPDSYVVPSHPIIPIRPGFYPGPVPFDGYYGPPRMSFCNTNERDAPSMGLAGGPYVGNPNQNVHPDSGNFHFRPGGYGPSSVMAKDPMESTHSRDACRGPYKVLLKQHDSWDGNDVEEKREPAIKPMTQNDWEADCRKPTDLLKPAVEGSYPNMANDKKEHSSVPFVRNLPDNTSKTKAVDDGLVKKPETASKAAEGPQQYPAIKKSPTLIDKIEGLNTKARISEGRYEAVCVSTMEKAKEFRMGNVKADHPTNESVSSVVYNENACSGSMILSSSNDVVDASTGDKNLESTMVRMVVSRQVEPQDTSVSTKVSSDVGEKAHPEIHKRERGMQGRVDFRGRERLNSHEGEEWKKKPLPMDSSVSVTNADTCRDVCLQDHHTYQEATETQEPIHLGKAGGGLYMTSSFDSTDYQGQRAKMKEIATQRAKQLQKEEEERSREQKAKALAKLEELNKRTLAENATLKSESDLQVKKESLVNAEPQTYNSVPDEVSGCVSGWAFDAVPQTELSTSKSMEAFERSLQGPVVAVNLSVPSSQDANATDSTAEQMLSKQKQMGHKRKQHNSHEKNLSDKMIATGGTKVHRNVIVNPNASSVESGLGNNVGANDDLPLQHKKKNNRSTKNKHKADEASMAVASLSSATTEESLMKASDENVKPKTLELVLETSSVEPQTVREVVKNLDSQDVVCADQGWSQQTEEAHGRISNQWKPQHPRRMSRNTQAFRPAEKLHGNDGVVWAPVRPPQIKNEPSEAADTNTNTDGGHSLGKNSYGTQNILKGKRADIERYVPKPVAKELSQHESFQNPLTPSAQVISKDMRGKADFGSESSKSLTQTDSLAVVKTDLVVDSKNGESKHNKHGRTHVSWRQRSSAEPSTVLQSSREDPSPLDMKMTSQKPFEQQQLSKKDVHSPKGQALKYSDNLNINNPTSTEPVLAAVIVTDHGVPGRGKRQPSKVQRIAGHSHIRRDNKDLVVGVTNKTDSFASFSESSKADGSSLGVENQGVGENVSSYWQPKSQAFSTCSRQGWAGGGGQRTTVQVGGTPEKEEFSLLGTSHVQQQAERNNDVQPQPNQPRVQKSAAHVVNKSGRKGIDTFKENNRLPNKGPPSIAELVPEDVDTYHEQQMVSSGQHRQGPHNGRFNRGQEAPYGGVPGNSQGQEVNKQRVPTIGDRGKHNSHYEYQPVGSHNKPSDSFKHDPNVGEEARDGARGMGVRYRERSQVSRQSQSRRGGHFYGRNGGSGIGVATHGNGE